MYGFSVCSCTICRKLLFPMFILLVFDMTKDKAPMFGDDVFCQYGTVRASETLKTRREDLEEGG